MLGQPETRNRQAVQQSRRRRRPEHNVLSFVLFGEPQLANQSHFHHKKGHQTCLSRMTGWQRRARVSKATRRTCDTDGADVWLRIIVAIGTLGTPPTNARH